MAAKTLILVKVFSNPINLNTKRYNCIQAMIIRYENINGKQPRNLTWNYFQEFLIVPNGVRQ